MLQSLLSTLLSLHLALPLLLTGFSLLLALPLLALATEASPLNRVVG